MATEVDLFIGQDMYRGTTLWKSISVKEDGVSVTPTVPKFRVYKNADNTPVTSLADATAGSGYIGALIPSGNTAQTLYVAFTFQVGSQICEARIKFNVV